MSKGDNLQSNLVLMHGDSHKFIKWYSALKGSKNNDIFEAKDIIATKGCIESPHGDLRVISVFDEVSKELVYDKREINKQMKWEHRVDFKLYVEFLNSEQRLPKLEKEIEKDELVKAWKKLHEAQETMRMLKSDSVDFENMNIEEIKNHLAKEIEVRKS